MVIGSAIDYEQAQFSCSYAEISTLPPDENIEIAFVGRSNVGKSSVINALTRQKNLAKTSSTPGRTQLLNFFELDERRYLVDLPGFGYAKVPPKIKARWHQTLDRYLRERESLRGVVLVMDIRHPLMPFDLQMIDWCAASQLPLHILLNKADKLTRNTMKVALDTVQTHIDQIDTDWMSVQTFSALKRQGIDKFKARLDQLYQV